MGYIDPALFDAAQFTDEIESRRPCATIILAGLEGTGKTDWSLTAPKPLLYQATDMGDEGVIQKFKAGGARSIPANCPGQILRPKGGDYKLVIPHEYRAFVDRLEKDEERKVREGKLANYVHEAFYTPFFRDYKNALDMGVRTIVWDTALEIWEYVRLSVYGRGATNRDDLKTEANAKFKEMIRLAGTYGANLILINRLKPKWESYYEPDGSVGWRQSATEQEMQGYDKSPELVALNLWTKFSKDTEGKPSWEFVIKKSRDVPEFTGATIPAMPFVELMGMLIPGVEPEAWTA